MADLITVLQIIFVFAAVSIPAVLLVKVTGGDEVGSILSAWQVPSANAWPRGVQEGEPIPFRFDAVQP